MNLPGVDAPERDASKSQWFTPPDTAARIADFAVRRCYHSDIRPKRVLEPSCGDGALLRALAPLVLFDVTAVDIDNANIQRCLDQRWPFTLTAVCADFLEWQPDKPFDLAVMNPPFEREQAMTHVLHALEFCRYVVAHVPLTTLAGIKRREKLWSTTDLFRLAICSSRPKYGGKGGATDMCTIAVCKRRPDQTDTSVEWWP